MSEIGQTYYDFWASLLPRSNRQTGFSLRSPTRLPYVEFCRVGFCFRYRLEYETPNARVEFALLRSDGEQIYNSLIRQRKQIDEAFGGDGDVLRGDIAHRLISLGIQFLLVMQ